MIYQYVAGLLAAIGVAVIIVVVIGKLNGSDDE